MRELSNRDTVGRVLVDTELDALAEQLENFVVVIFLENLGKHHEALLHQVLLDESCFAGETHERCSMANPQSRQRTWQSKPLWDEFIAIIQDEDTADVQLDVGVW